MLVIEIPRSNSDLIAEVQNTFQNCEMVEVDSLGADTIIQILVPTITVGIPALSAIIVQILKRGKTVVKYNKIEVSGTPKNISRILEAIRASETSDDSSSTPVEGGLDESE